jgi:ubiquinol-cytochrome c reductase cytochrome b subunit
VTSRFDTLLEFLALKELAGRLRMFEVSDNALSWRRSSGSLILVLIILLLLSGAVMVFYYSPVPGAAYDSVDFSIFDLPFGGVIRGIHHYAWNLLLITAGLHLLQTLICGAYKAPRQLVWVSGVLICLILPLFIITGDLLPWDQKGYWSTQVRLSIISSVPLVGDFMTRIFQGGSLTGIVALTRFYVLHILILPGMLFLLVAVHFHFIYRRGLADSLFGRPGDRKKTPLPTILNRFLMLFLVVTLILGLISWYWPSPFGDPADPTDSNFIPKPEWWVLFLNQLVAIFKGPLMVLGSAIIPGGLTGLVLLLPFIDRSPDRHPARRLKTIISAATIAVVLLGLSIMGYIEHFGTTAH